MKTPILAVKFATSDAGNLPRRTKIDLEVLDGLERAASEDGPAAHVVRARDLQSFRELKNLVTDRGMKLKRKELSARLLGQKGIPIIEGSYTSSGQLRRSIRTLLRRAATHGGKDTGTSFIIGAPDQIFDDLWKRALDRSQEPASDEEALLELLGAEAIPEDLVRKYIGVSLQARLVRHLIMRAAGHEASVLIIGDTGTGKEVVARSIHEYSRRRHETFVPVNCAAIPSDLFESELFGHEPGSFTGAQHRKPGLWRAADRGTLFLDEIGDLRPDHQAKILRSLQEHTIRPVGGTDIRVDARVLMATNRDLFGMVQAGRFRKDLYYRLLSFFIPTPSLKSHPQDVPLLAQAFWKAITRDPDATLSEKIVEVLTSQDWPGNARELKAVLTNLHGLFGPMKVGVEHLTAVSRLQSGVIGSRRTPADKGRDHRLECLRHLRKVSEVVQGCAVILRPLIEGKNRLSGIKRRSFKQRLGELDKACLQPALFSSDLAFQVVARLKDRLADMLPLLDGDLNEARRHGREELEPAFALALSAILREIDRLANERR